MPFVDEVLASAPVRIKAPVFTRAAECTVVVQWYDGPSGFQLRTQTVPNQSVSTAEIQSVGESQHDSKPRRLPSATEVDDDGLAAQP